MAVPKYDELMKPLLTTVKDGEVYKIKDVTAVLAQQLNLSAEDLAEMLPSGRQTVFKNRVGWAKTYLKKAGLLDSPARATIVITEAGKKVVAENPEKIDSKYLEQFPSFVDFASASDPTNGDDTVPVISKQTDLTPDDQLEDAYKQINASLAWTVPLFFTWGISGIMLTMMALGQGVIGRVPVTHAISLVGALMFLHTEPYVGADTAILFGILGGIMGMAVQEFGARVFWNHGGNHIDPPAFSIAVNTLFINILFSFII